MDEDSNSGFELLSSQPEKIPYDEVPEDILFKFKVQDAVTSRKISYKLKHGSFLPYSTNVGGTN